MAGEMRIGSCAEGQQLAADNGSARMMSDVIHDEHLGELVSVVTRELYSARHNEGILSGCDTELRHVRC